MSVPTILRVSGEDFMVFFPDNADGVERAGCCLVDEAMKIRKEDEDSDMWQELCLERIILDGKTNVTNNPPSESCQLICKHDGCNTPVVGKAGPCDLVLSLERAWQTRGARTRKRKQAEAPKPVTVSEFIDTTSSKTNTQKHAHIV